MMKMFMTVLDLSNTGYILYKCTINSYSDIESELKVSRRLNHELLH